MEVKWTQEVVKHISPKLIKQEKYSDWHLPDRHELRSLISRQTRRPALPQDALFINVFNGWYWSSTITAAISPAYAWYVNKAY